MYLRLIVGNVGIPLAGNSLLIPDSVVTSYSWARRSKMRIPRALGLIQQLGSTSVAAGRGSVMHIRGRWPGFPASRFSRSPVWKLGASRVSGNFEHDLAPCVPALIDFVRLPHFGQRQHSINYRRELPLVDEFCNFAQNRRVYLCGYAL